MRLGLLVVAGAIAVAAIALLSGGSGSSVPLPRRSETTTGPITHQRSAGPGRLVAKASSARLPAPLSGQAAAPAGSSVLVIGGIDASDASTASVSEIGPGAARVRGRGSLATPLHDVAAATVGNETLVFGGGEASTVDSVEALAPGRPAGVVGHLPGPRSDASAVTVGDSAFVFGGYDGVSTVAPVLETPDGRSFRTIGSLQIPVRYAAVAAIGPTIYALGGELADGADTDAIQAIDTRTGKVSVVGHIPTALSHASAIALGGRVYLLGGRVGGVNGSATRTILAFDPPSRRVSAVGRLPMAVTNAAAATAGGVGYLAGGLGASGSPLASIVTLRLKAEAPTG